MKHLHYGSIVIAISDQLASTFQTAAHDFMAAGRSAVWPVSGYRDDRDEISIQLAIGPGIAFAITDTDDEHEALEKEQLREAVRNVLVYGRFDRHSTKDAGRWRFSGHSAVVDAHDPQAAVSSLNREGIDVVSMTESGAPGDSAWSNVYIVGRYVDAQL